MMEINKVVVMQVIFDKIIQMGLWFSCLLYYHAQITNRNMKATGEQMGVPCSLKMFCVLHYTLQNTEVFKFKFHKCVLKLLNTKGIS